MPSSAGLCDAGQKRVVPSETCVDCPLGEYQTEGSYSGTTCQTCPVRGLEDQTTAAVGATSAESCVGKPKRVMLFTLQGLLFLVARPKRK